MDNKPVDKITEWSLGKRMGSSLRQRLLDDIREANQAEPETERRDLPPENIDDGSLFCLWIRS